MRILFLGATKFSYELLSHLYSKNIEVNAVFTIPEKFKISYNDKKVKNYNYYNLSDFAQSHGINLHVVDHENGQTITSFKEIIAAEEPDIILVMGWYYMVPKSIRNLAKYGCWGIHASMLPKYAGGAPLVWAIIEGETETGVTLFKLDDGIDDGDIIAQKSFEITYDDTIDTVYKKATEVSKQILIEAITNVDKIKFQPQDKEDIEVYPQRKPEDGLIDLNWESKRIYDFIRAQSSPYPGAFFKTIDNKKLIIEKARIEEL